MIDPMLKEVKPFLPLLIEEVSWDNISFHMHGEDWGFYSMCPWRVIENKKMIYGCSDLNSDFLINQIKGLYIGYINCQSNSLRIDPAFVLSNGQILEFFSIDTYEPWVFGLHDFTTYIASPSDPDSFTKGFQLSESNDPRWESRIIKLKHEVKYQIQYETNRIWPLVNILNEVCNGLHIKDFEKTISASKYAVEDLLTRLSLFNRNSRYTNYRDLYYLKFTDKEKASIPSFQLSEFELTILQKSCNETRNQIKEWEFFTRIGVGAEEVAKIVNTIEEIDKPLVMNNDS